MHAGMAGDGGQTSQETGVVSRVPQASAWYWDPVKGTICNRSEVLLEFPHLVCLRADQTYLRPEYCVYMCRFCQQICTSSLKLWGCRETILAKEQY